MSKITDGDSRVIVRKLLILFPLFYALFYLLAVIFAAIFGTITEFSGAEPFDYAWSSFGGDSGRALVGLLSTLVAFVIVEPLLLYFVVQSTTKAWDYTATLLFWHLVICFIVSRSAPVNWAWWIVVVIGSFVSWVIGELCCYFFRDLKEIPLDH
jgi:predicted benzoate:H+ symporter BenE